MIIELRKAREIPREYLSIITMIETYCIEEKIIRYDDIEIALSKVGINLLLLHFGVELTGTLTLENVEKYLRDYLSLREAIKLERKKSLDNRKIFKIVTELKNSTFVLKKTFYKVLDRTEDSLYLRNIDTGDIEVVSEDALFLFEDEPILCSDENMVDVLEYEWVSLYQKFKLTLIENYSKELKQAIFKLEEVKNENKKEIT